MYQRMDAIGEKIVRADDFLWHWSNFGVGVSMLVATGSVEIL